MNHKSQEWLTLSQWLRQRGQQLRRAGQMGASTPSAKLPPLEDVELQAFVRENNLTEANSQRCRQLEVEAAYQAILAAPGSEQSILEQLGYTQDKSRLDSIYAHASTYTRWLEDEAMRESSLIQRTGRRGRWLQVALLVATVLCLTVGGWGYFTFQNWKRYLENPAGTLKGNTKLVIPRGSDTETVARLLKESGVIQHQEQFFLLVRYHHYLKNIFPELQRVGRVRLRAGTYEISTNLTPQQILSVLRKGPKRKSIRVTIPEGFNLWKIAARLEKKGVCRSADFIRYAKDPNHARKVLGWEAPRLEGYLYPDTYRFFKNTSPTLVIERMVGRFKKVFNPTFRKRAQELGWTIHQATTMASIVEKETGQKKERPKISSVFHNRLRRKWKLQTDPTVIYGLLPNFNGNITRKDLRNPHKYNTYRHKGLPPGPIASPGLAAIRAALYPLRTRYMYFVSKNDGSHIFSRTLRQHNKWVNLYQKRRR